MEQWIRATFRVDHDWINADGSTADAFSFTNPDTGITTKAPVLWFVQMFGSVSVPPTATLLRAVDPSDSLGWHRHFDAWAAQGIIQP